MAEFNIEYAGRSETGPIRQINEDSIVIDSDIGLAIVADGLGGHNAGNVASVIATETMVETIRAQLDSARLKSLTAKNSNFIFDVLTFSLNFTNNFINVISQRHKACDGMGTTLLTCLFINDTVVISNVGDSRLYRFRDSNLLLLTTDHAINEAGVKKLTKAVGTRSEVEGDLFAFPLLVADQYMLCSDGLSDFIVDTEIVDVLTTNLPLKDKIDAMYQLAIANKSADNISIIIVKITEDTQDAI